MAPPEVLKWDITVAVVRKDDGAIAILIRQLRVRNVFPGNCGDAWRCSMPVENVVTKHCPFEYGGVQN